MPPHADVIVAVLTAVNAGDTNSGGFDSVDFSDGDVIVLIATNHACIKYQELANWTECIVDTRNAMAVVPTLPNQVWKA